MVDFRKQLNGLMVLIVDALDKDPASGELFLFPFGPSISLAVHTGTISAAC